MTGGRGWAAPLASGALLALSAPPASSPVLPFVALAPLAAWVLGLPSHGAGTRRALLGGALAGALQHGWGLRWLPGTLAAIAGPAAGGAAACAVVAVLAACTGVAAAALHRLVRGRGALPLAVALPVAWTALEWGLAHLPLGLAFPWAPLGLGLARWPRALGVAELVGMTGVTAWLAAVSGLLADAAGQGGGGARGRAAAGLGLAALLAAAPLAFGAARARTQGGPVLGRVVVLALDVPVGTPPAERAEAGVAAATAAFLDIPAGSADLVVLPEMILPLDPASPAGAPLLARLRALGDGVGAALLVGTVGVDGGAVHNSALLVGGRGPFRADKRRLVPGAERGTAVRAPWLGPGASGYAPGAGWPVARVDELGVGALICFEVAFAGDARRLVRGGATLLVALSNDAWFGSGGAGRAGIAQQSAHLVARAIETGTAAARAANGGPALAVAPGGTAVARADRGALTASVRSPRATLWVRTGDGIGPAALLTLLVLLVRERRRHGFSG